MNLLTVLARGQTLEALLIAGPIVLAARGGLGEDESCATNTTVGAVTLLQ